jgi:hypothetical protein
VRTLLPSSSLSLALAAALGLWAAPARGDDTRARCIAAIPFGAGQFQNGDVGLGITFAAGEVLLGGGSIATAVIVNALASTRVSFATPVTIAARNDHISDVVTVNRVLFAGWAALAVTGVIEAEVTIGHPRAAPKDAPSAPSPSVTATAAPIPGGASLGLRAAF